MLDSLIRFNSLQTGKHIQSCPTLPMALKSSTVSFNSLQTGKHIQSWVWRLGERLVRQSFQFPSNGKAYTKLDAGGGLSVPSSIEFQFPSNGKAYTKPNRTRIAARRAVVFQFPSNGKAYTKWTLLTLTLEYRCFNSLQTGKHIQRVMRINPADWIRKSFNSLQTGKHIQRGELPVGGQIETGFNSLQTGKHIQSKFDAETCRKALSFNSLQTGKHIQRRLPNCPAEWRTISFNSLQTGKHIQRAPILSPVGPWLRKPQNIRELRTAFFLSKFSPKIPQTYVYIELYAIFWEKRLESHTLSGFLGNLYRVRLWSTHRVYGYKYTSNLQECQIFLIFQDGRNLDCGLFCSLRFFGKYSVLVPQANSLWYKRAACVVSLKDWVCYSRFRNDLDTRRVALAVKLCHILPQANSLWYKRAAAGC